MHRTASLGTVLLSWHKLLSVQATLRCISSISNKCKSNTDLSVKEFSTAQRLPLPYRFRRLLDYKAKRLMLTRSCASLIGRLDQISTSPAQSMRSSVAAQ